MTVVVPGRAVGLLQPADMLLRFWALSLLFVVRGDSSVAASHQGSSSRSFYVLGLLIAAVGVYIILQGARVLAFACWGPNVAQVMKGLGLGPPKVRPTPSASEKILCAKGKTTDSSSTAWCKPPSPSR